MGWVVPHVLMTRTQVLVNPSPHVAEATSIYPWLKPIAAEAAKNKYVILAWKIEVSTVILPANFDVSLYNKNISGACHNLAVY